MTPFDLKGGKRPEIALIFLDNAIYKCYVYNNSVLCIQNRPLDCKNQVQQKIK